MIGTCKCTSPFQDKQYGKGQRVLNSTKDGEARCTVCGNVSVQKREKKERNEEETK